MTAADVGLKALGLLALPKMWALPFFVVTQEAIQDLEPSALDSACEAARTQLGLGDRLFVRSSGVNETIGNRGRLISEPCRAADLATSLRRVSSHVSAPASRVHWIVQEFVEAERQGHLSNERRFSYEPRDWAVETEGTGDQREHVSRVAYRPWRDGRELDTDALRCASEPQITLLLKRVCRWGLDIDHRLHFEWIWTGSQIFLVQADVAERDGGVLPASLMPTTVPRIDAPSLSTFVVATPEHFERYNKLKNAQTYRQLGYDMPPFFVLDSPTIIAQVLAHEVPDQMAKDLAELTKRPLIIRTDSSGTSGDSKVMLPRSDELRSAGEAIAWLTGTFRQAVTDSNLSPDGLCLIAHHFIPSIASAWARAAPGTRMVRIESLWGLPEGLYWHSHDTFEVDLEARTYSKRRRFKGTFIGPDPVGRWVAHRTQPPADWRPSIRRRAWLFEIAEVTRSIAEREKRPVSAMWFIDNHRDASTHEVLPWFHSESDLKGSPKAAPRRKVATARHLRIEQQSDWDELRASLARAEQIERIVVAPLDPVLIRNAPFVDELAKLAATHDIVVELAGGLLSHAYYVLQRHNVRVECVDLFGAEPDIIEYNKLVRDRIPRSIESHGERVEVIRVTGEAFLTVLRQKLVEEAYEALDARAGDDLIGELADVLEVTRAIAKALGVDFDQVEQVREEKLQRRGGFDAGVMLRRTATPHSLTPSRASTSGDVLAGASLPEAAPSVASPTDLPTNAPYVRPDLRTVGHQPEKVLTFETDLHKSASDRIASRFSLPIDPATSRDFTLSIDFGRSRTSLRGTVKLRLEPEQLAMDLTGPDEPPAQATQSQPPAKRRN